MSGETIDRLTALWNGFDVIDLSPTLERGMPHWPSHPHLVIDPTVYHERDGYYCQTVSMAEHTGSHVDAPCHANANLMDKTIEKYPANLLIGRAVVYNFSDVEIHEGDQIDAELFINYEKKKNISTKPDDIILINFGWFKKYWINGREGLFYSKNSPGLNEAAVKYLYDKKIKAVGCDNIACDEAVVNGVSKMSYGHKKYWLPHDILIIEELANLDRLPDYCFFVALPLKIKNGSGSPIRPIALIRK